MSLETYQDRWCDRYLPQIIASAEKRGLQAFWVLASCQSRATGKPYFRRTIAAVVEGKPVLGVRCNRKGSVYWDRIGEYYQPSYTIQDKVSPPMTSEGGKEVGIRRTTCKLFPKCTLKTSRPEGWCEQHYQNWIATGDASKAALESASHPPQEGFDAMD